MQSSTGRVESVSGDRVVVWVDAELVCARCASGKGCGAGLFGRRDGARTIEAVLPGALVASAGDDVEISMMSTRLLAAAAIVYGLPLALGITAAVFAWFAGFGDAAAAAAALAGLVSGLLLAKWRLREERCLREFTPTVTKLGERSA